jgi:predicted RNA binding protein YcfA (HicA-like mRNA interferase family)
VSRRLPSLTPRQVLRALQRAGWETHRTRGSHVSVRKEGCPYVVTVPMHARDMPRGTLMDIIKDAGLTPQEFADLL